MPHASLIDTHQHPVPDFYKRAMAKVGISGSGENPWPEWSLQAQLDLMDGLGDRLTGEEIVAQVDRAEVGARRTMPARPDPGGTASSDMASVVTLTLVSHLSRAQRSTS